MNAPTNRFAPDTVGAALASAEKIKPDTVAALVDGQLLDLQAPMPENKDSNNIVLKPVSIKSNDALTIIRHTTAHVMADAVQRLFPKIKVTIGPSIETGFYYDFDRPEGRFTEEELLSIEKEMNIIIKEEHPLIRKEVTHEQAKELFSSKNESYKLELLDSIDKNEVITLYYHGQWVDLCAGPHLPNTKFIKSFKLLSSAGAYWRGDERNKMLSRIYGTAFADKKALQKYILNIEEAKKRDHRKLGKELDLFSIDDQIGAGLVLWHPKGAMVRTIVEDHWRKAHIKSGYDLVITPHIGRAHLWETSGHLANYADAMYAPMDIEGNPYYIKPMNCPFHISIYRNSLKSYRDLPIRWAELGTVYRNERSGQLHGLLRVRGFTQDDAHLFIRPDQLNSEIDKLIKFSIKLLGDFGFTDLKIMVATKPEKKYIGSPEIWDAAESALKDGLKACNVKYTVDEGGGAFYGPKIDIKICDAIGRMWQCTTIQVDFNLPERFNLTYIGEDNARHRPVMIHRALLGSIERFLGIMIEHYAGAFPLWLAPQQVALLTVTDAHREFAQKLAIKLEKNDIRMHLNLDNDKLGAKIRKSRLMRIPAMAIIGDKEVEQGGVSLRTRADGELGFKPLDEFIDWIVKAAAKPAI